MAKLYGERSRKKERKKTYAQQTTVASINGDGLIHEDGEMRTHQPHHHLISSAYTTNSKEREKKNTTEPTEI